MIRYEDMKNMPEEFWTNLKEKLFEDFLEDFKQNSWFEIDTNEYVESLIPDITINTEE